MQGSTEDCLPMKGHTRGPSWDAPTVLVIERTHRGGDSPTKQTNERTHKFFLTDTLTHAQSHILRQHAA